MSNRLCHGLCIILKFINKWFIYWYLIKIIYHPYLNPYHVLKISKPYWNIHTSFMPFNIGLCTLDRTVKTLPTLLHPIQVHSRRSKCNKKNKIYPEHKIRLKRGISGPQDKGFFLGLLRSLLLLLLLLSSLLLRLLLLGGGFSSTPVHFWGTPLLWFMESRLFITISSPISIFRKVFES